MTNNDKVKTNFRLLGELATDSLFPQVTDTSETAETVSDDAEPIEETAESDPDMWLTLSPDLQWRAAKLGQC